MLSEQAKAALERLHNDSILGLRADMHLILRDYEIIREALMGMCPVKTLNGVVILWDDKITPERIYHSGFLDLKVRFICESLEVHFTHGEVMFWRVGGYPLSHKLWPANMGEVWQLMAKCGCPVGGGE